MCDCFEDLMDDDNFEDSFDEDTEMDEPFAGDPEFDNEPYETDSQNDEFKARDAFILVGGAMGFAYEVGLRERKRSKRKKFRDD